MTRNETMMRWVLVSLFTLVASTALILTATRSGRTQSPRDYSFTDKLFGKHFSFTPKPDEVMIRFAAQPKKLNQNTVQAATAQAGLTLLHEAIAQHHFGVFRLPAGSDFESATARLRASGVVQAVCPVMIDQDGYTRYFMPDELTVQFDPRLPEAEMRAIIRDFGSSIVKDQWTPGYYTLALPPGRELFETVREFMRLPQVQFAEPSYIGFNDFAFDPNDASYAQQWALRNTGANGGTVDADIDAREAWDIERGDAHVVVVIIDTGVDWDHPDLRPNILQNLGEDADGDGQTMALVAGNWVLDPGDLDGMDNDGNGLTDDLLGWDFDDDDNNPNDEGDHGTACAGIAAAVTDNATGVAGVAHNCRIMPLRINLSAGMNQNRADAINYAAAMSANYDGMVLSCSWIASGDVTALRSAIVNAKNDGVVVCFASGNFEETSVRFPARVEAAIAVGATSECDERKSPTSCDGENWWGSNSGDSLDIAAPGVHIFTTDRAGAAGYDPTDYVSDFNGTSSATPHVAGAAALLLSYDPSLTPDEVQDILQVSADHVGGYNYNHDATRPGHSLELGYGRLNVNRALQELIARKVIILQPEPVDIALSIDRSGSMTPPKLSAARNAAAQVVRLMNIDDRVAVTSYDHNVFVNFNLANITSEAVKDNAITAINAITAGGATSIGGGLVTAQGQFLLAVPPHYPQAIILMSDGMSNTAPWVQQVTPLLPGTTDVYTIGFSTSGVDIDEDSLQYMASTTGGQYFFAGADGLGAAPGPQGKQEDPNLITSVTGGLELIKSYQASLNIASGRQMMRHISRKYQDQYSDSVFVDASVDEMRFSFLLDSKPAALLFELRTPGGKTIDPGVAAGDPLIDYLEDATLASYTVRKPERGLWLVVARASRVEKMFLSASGYSHLKGILTVEEFGLRLPLLVQLRLIERGLPVLKSQVRGQLGLPNNQFLPFTLFDDGQHRDGLPNDGIYGNSVFTSATGGLAEGGSYTVETTATGLSNLSGDFYTRYNVASAFIPFRQDRKPIRVALPNSLALPGSLVRIPIHINNDVFGRDLGAVAAGIKFDPKILQPTGKFETRNTMMNAAWAVDLNLAQAGLVELKASGPALQGNGILLNVLFEAVGNLGESTPLEFSHFEFNSGTVPVETSDGFFTVGSTFLERTVTLNKPKGWSLASLPVESIEPALRGVFPKAQAAFKFVPGEGYKSIDQLEPGMGFWLSLPEAGAATVTGLPVAEASYRLAKGWNLIGGLYDQAAKPQTKPANAIQAMFRFDPQTGYATTEVVLPGEAVWLSCAQPCSLWLTQSIKATAALALAAGELAWEATITSTGEEAGAAVNVSSVVIGAGTSGPNALPAPPTAPQFTTNLQLWELNFSSGPFAKDTRAINTPESKWVLEVDPHGNVPPPAPRNATVSWDASKLGNGTWELRDGFDGSGAIRIADMKSTTSFVVTGNSAQYFTIIYHPVITGVQEKNEGGLPDRFALHQNYPNPFNPETSIRYDLPAAGQVTIQLYNLTGQLVRTLVSGEFAAGVHVVRWDGRDDHGQRVAAGVYFYSLKTEAFQQRKKMVLLP